MPRPERTDPVIHYHGTPCGGPKVDAAKFLAGRHAFVPFPSPCDLPSVAAVCQSFAFDNGAFSAWTRGLMMDVPGYMAWVEEWHRHPAFDWAVIPDVIEGSEEENDAMLVDWPSHLPGVPVYHLHESLERLERLVSQWPRVALGSSGAWATPGTDGWWERIGAVMAVACDKNGRPRCRLHGLRMLNPDVFTRLPLASADSCNAARNCHTWAGPYCPPSAAIRMEVIASRIEVHQSPPVWVPSEQRDLFTLEA